MENGCNSPEVSNKHMRVYRKNMDYHHEQLQLHLANKCKCSENSNGMDYSDIRIMFFKIGVSLF